MNVNNYLTVLDELKSVPDTNTDKLIRVAGVITAYVKDAYDIDLIVVGGLSVEIYTDGGYTTQDIDFVGVNHEKIMQALSDLGFRREGRNSIHDELKVFVEVPDSVLKDADERYISIMVLSQENRLKMTTYFHKKGYTELNRHVFENTFGLYLRIVVLKK